LENFHGNHLVFAVMDGVMCSDVQASGPVLTEKGPVYTKDQVLDFSIEVFLLTYTPRLTPHAERYQQSIN
ncbi:MAG: hypothetical protein PVI92_12295, partial [Chromatiales bacterium]